MKHTQTTAPSSRPNRINLAIRIAFYLVGFLIMTLGIAVSVKSDLGVSPVSSIPYTITCITGLDLGLSTIVFHVALVVLQIVLLRRAFKAKNLLQVPVGVLFGAFTTFSVNLFAFIPTPTDVWVQIVMMLVSTVLIAFGIFLYVPADFIPLAGEGAMLAIAQITKKKFSSVKLAFDITMMVVSLVTCLLVLHSLGSVGIGTVIAAVLVGSELKVLNRFFGAARERVLAIGRVEAEVAAEGAENLTPLQQIMQRDVYTVSQDASYLDALRFLSEKKISGAPVVDDAGNLVGFISDGDILRRLASEHSPFVNAAAFGKTDFNEKLLSVMSLRISEIAVKNVITVDAADDLSEVCYKLAENHLKKAPVMCAGRMVGVVNRSNITDYAAGLIGA